MKENAPCIMVFVRDPVLGEVKTRLARKLGAPKTLEFYIDCVNHMLRVLNSTGYPIQIHYFPDNRGESVSGWFGDQYRYIPQRGDDLGYQMINAFLNSFSEGYSRSILIGSDIPEITSTILKESVSALAQNQVVLGPSADGGYYLIGFHSSSFLPEAFRNIQWGTGAVFQETTACIRGKGLSLHVLPTLHDIDELEDLIGLLKRASPLISSTFAEKNYLDSYYRPTTGKFNKMR
jgi:hypothetical protein